VLVRLTDEPADLVDADFVVLPGSKSTVDDLGWLRERGLADAVTAHAATGKPLLGICGGFQMLAERIHDDVESGRGTVAGLGLLPIEVTFDAGKTLGTPEGVAFGEKVHGYEIHHGRVTKRAGDLPALTADEGARRANVFGTHWHGTFESDGYRRAFLTEAARLAGRGGFAVAPDTSYAALRERTVDTLADLVGAHLDTDALWSLIERGR
jgi:adenosylcobyric acid synthase